MFQQEYQQQVNELLELGWDKIRKDERELRKLNNIYRQAHGKNACCSSVLKKFVKKELSNLTTNKSIVMKKTTVSKSRFKLKPGVRYVPSMQMHVTNENLTDELAERLLNDNPMRKHWFEIIPSDFTPKTAEPAGDDNGGDDPEDHSTKTKAELIAMLLQADEQYKEPELKKLNKQALLDLVNNLSK